ncbi:MAG: hypothetical protein JWM44_3104 [Bacilli bacterium]|nr:hypothetical protein [Bacilli bacterium]
MGLIYDREFTDLEKSLMLTVGQMIDTIKHGEIAECINGFYEGSKVLRTDNDEIIFTDSKDFFKMTTFAHDSKWILQK